LKFVLNGICEIVLSITETGCNLRETKSDFKLEMILNNTGSALSLTEIGNTLKPISREFMKIGCEY